MSRRDSDFLKKLRATFQIEAEERVRAVASGLIELEKATEAGKQAEIVEAIFREVHSLKGAARAVNLTQVETICQSLEDIFAALKRQEIVPALALLDLLHQAIDILNARLASPDAEPTDAEKSRQTLLLRQLKDSARGNVMAAGPATPPPETPQPETQRTTDKEPDVAARALHDQMPTATDAEMRPPELETYSVPAPAPEERHLLAETVRIPAARLESLLLQVEELLSAKLAMGQRAAEVQEAHALLVEWNKKWAKEDAPLHTLSQSVESSSIRNGHALQQQNGQRNSDLPLTELLEFLEWNRARVESMESKLIALSQSIKRDHRTFGGMVDHLLQDVKQLLMLPFSSIVETLPSLMRDLARRQGKEVQTVIHGAGIEVDRRILQEIKDPLIHLVRNCIDHGIEIPEIRAQKQKPQRGTVKVTIAQRDSSKVEVLISDDGAGIDIPKVRETAVRLGLTTPEAAEKLNEQELLSFVFQSGLSTSPLITDISGRGLGLAIVQEKVEKLGGVITLETAEDAGATFRLFLPLTLATLRGLVVCAEGHRLILPIIYLERVIRVNREDIQTVQNRDTISLDGQPLSLVQLGHALELPRQSVTPAPVDMVTVVILSAAEKRIAFLVDEILGEQEVLMKGLGPQLARVRNIANATVLGTGQVAAILNVPDLMKTAIKAVDGPKRDTVEQLASQEKSILVAEDSITARTQLKNILELSGYTVKTAVDGMDALMILRTETFDLVISDVDMPRLNGFDLTARIRSDKNLADLPVLLVTALASRQDQERGLEVGANAYIVKSNFDQNNLLDVIRRLI